MAQGAEEPVKQPGLHTKAKDLAKNLMGIEQSKTKAHTHHRDVSRKQVTIRADPDTADPDAAWMRLKKGLTVREVEPTKRTEPIRADRVRFVCISDTHSKIEEKQDFHVPDGDVLLIAGDMTMSGSCDELVEFNKFIGKLPHKHKLAISGNHEFHLDDDSWSSWSIDRVRQERLEKYGVHKGSELLTNCTLLQDELVEVAGLKIYGSPWSPLHGAYAFSLLRGAEMLEKWNLIPECTDILMTHAPPLGIGDNIPGGFHAGCVELLNTVQHRVKPKYHVFGHIHEGYGMYTNGTTTFINSSICKTGYLADNPPIVFDLPLPKGHSKNDPMVQCGNFWLETRDDNFANKSPENWREVIKEKKLRKSGGKKEHGHIKTDSVIKNGNVGSETNNGISATKL